MSYRLIDANNIIFNSNRFITADNINKMPCIYADLPNGMDGEHYVLEQEPSSSEKPNKWIPVSEKLPETDNKNEINGSNVLLWVANKTHPEREPQIYLGKLRKVNGDDGSGNFWGIETKPCDWTIWGWSYFNEPEVIAWMPLPEPFKVSEIPTGSESNRTCHTCKHYTSGEHDGSCGSYICKGYSNWESE